MEMPWGPIPDEPAPESVRRGIAAGIRSNLRAGLRLATFRPVGREDFWLGRAQANVFMAMGAALVIAFHVTLNTNTWRFQAEDYGVLAGVLIALRLLSIMYARQYRDPDGGGGIIVIVVSSTLVPTLALAASAYAIELIADAVSSPWLLLYVPLGSARLTLVLWFAATLIRSFWVAYSVSVPRAVILSLVPIVGLEILEYVPCVAAVARVTDTSFQVPKQADLNVEQTFYGGPTARPTWPVAPVTRIIVPLHVPA